MDELNSFLSRVTRASLLFLSLCFLVWAFVPSFRPYAAGLILGTAVSLLNAWFLSVKVKQFAELVIRQERKRFNLGFLTRASLVILTLMLALKWDQVNVAAVIVGLFFTQLATILIGIFFGKKKP